MKNRLEALEKKEFTKDQGSLKEMVRSWVMAIENKQWDEALEIRKAADDQLSEVEDISRPPNGSPKSAFINWIWFLNFLNKDSREQFIEATKGNFLTGYVLIKN